MKNLRIISGLLLVGGCLGLSIRPILGMEIRTVVPSGLCNSTKKVDISGLDKVEVLRELYARARPFGLGYKHFVPGDLDRAEAAEILALGHCDIDYLKGRAMKIDLCGNKVITEDFNRVYGPRAAESAIAAVRAVSEKK